MKSKLHLLLVIIVLPFILHCFSPAFAEVLFASEAPHSSLNQLEYTTLVFEKNRGQFDPQVNFCLRAEGKTFFFTRKGVTVIVRERRGIRTAATNTSTARDRDPGDAWAVRLSFIGASLITPRGRSAARGTFNYFKGSPEQWLTAVPTYSEILYQSLWPGIDLIFSTTRNQLKYMFYVHPGADPESIRLKYKGADVSLEPSGRLLARTPMGSLCDHAPVAWQKDGDTHTEVASAYSLMGTTSAAYREYGFKIGPFDRSRPLIIDPGFIVYSALIGGTSSDESHAIAVDGNGSAYVTGETYSPDFPRSVGLVHAGSKDVFVCKIRPNGTGLVYSGFLGGSGIDIGYGIAVDTGGHAYVTGSTGSSDFPRTVGLPKAGDDDAFVCKIRPDGTGLVYSGFLGGDHLDSGRDIAVDAAGNAYVTGHTRSSDFHRTVGPPFAGGTNDAFVSKIRPDGKFLVYSRFLGGSADDFAFEIALDTDCNAYVTGSTYSSDFPRTVGPPHAGGSDPFICKIRPDAVSLVYSRFLGGTRNDSALGITVDTHANAYVTGATDSSDFPSTIGPTFGGLTDAFVSKVQSDGLVAYSRFLGGAHQDFGRDIAIDAAGNVYVTGSASSSNFPRTVGPEHAGYSDAFVSKIRPDGSEVEYSGFLGGDDYDRGNGITVDAAGNAYVTGYTRSSNFLNTVDDLPYVGGQDVFVAKINASVPSPGLISAPSLLLLLD